MALQDGRDSADIIQWCCKMAAILQTSLKPTNHCQALRDTLKLIFIKGYGNQLIYSSYYVWAPWVIHQCTQIQFRETGQWLLVETLNVKQMYSHKKTVALACAQTLMSDLHNLYACMRQDRANSNEKTETELKWTNCHHFQHFRKTKPLCG